VPALAHLASGAAPTFRHRISLEPISHNGVIAISGEKSAAMPDGTDAVALWRAKAAEARNHAQQVTDHQVRSALLRTAESYEHLAAIAERSALSQRSFETEGRPV
jgi:hypothetical protein